jgi:hypothetical protein
VKILKAAGITIGLSSLLGLLVGCPITSISQCTGYVTYVIDPNSTAYAESSGVANATSITPGFSIEFKLANSNPSFCPTSAATFSIVEKSPKPNWVSGSSIGGDGRLVVNTHIARFNASGQLTFPLETTKVYNISALITTPANGSLSVDFAFTYGSKYSTVPTLSTSNIPKAGTSPIRFESRDDTTYTSITSLNSDFSLTNCRNDTSYSYFCNIAANPNITSGAKTFLIRIRSFNPVTKGFLLRDQEFYPFNVN